MIFIRGSGAKTCCKVPVLLQISDQKSIDNIKCLAMTPSVEQCAVVCYVWMAKASTYNQMCRKRSVEETLVSLREIRSQKIFP